MRGFVDVWEPPVLDWDVSVARAGRVADAPVGISGRRDGHGHGH